MTATAVWGWSGPMTTGTSPVVHIHLTINGWVLRAGWTWLHADMTGTPRDERGGVDVYAR
jgi:hypothetical protein